MNLVFESCCCIFYYAVAMEVFFIFHCQIACFFEYYTYITAEPKIIVTLPVSPSKITDSPTDLHDINQTAAVSQYYCSIKELT